MSTYTTKAEIHEHLDTLARELSAVKLELGDVMAKQEIEDKARYDALLEQMKVIDLRVSFDFMHLSRIVGHEAGDDA